MSLLKRGKPLHWLAAGILLGILNVVILNTFVSDRPIGASTAFPYVAGLLTHQSGASYMNAIKKSGAWEMWFLAGALAGSFIVALSCGDFKISLLPSLWKSAKGSSSINRIVWAFIGGFLLLWGARLAGGCTSGHILSGGMQLAVSSLLFAAVVICSFLISGYLFYGRK